MNPEQPHDTIGMERPPMKKSMRAAIVFWVATAGLLLLVCIEVPNLLLLVLASVLFAIFVDSGTRIMCKLTGGFLPRTLAYAITVVALLATATGLSAFLGPRLYAQADQIIKELPEAIDELQASVGAGVGSRLVAEVGETVDAVNVSVNGDEEEQARAKKKKRKKKPRKRSTRRAKKSPELNPEQQKAHDEWMKTLRGVFTSTFGALGDLVIIIVLGLYFAWSPSLYRKALVRLVPIEKRDAFDEGLLELRHLLSRWLMVRLVSMTAVGLLTGGGLALLDVSYAWTLGLFAGLLSFIPNLGPILAAAPGVLVSLLDGGMSLALTVVGVYTGVQAIESYLLTPLMQQRAVELPPAALLLSQIFFGVLFGFMGLLLATPLLVVIKVAVQRIYVEGILGDTPEPSPVAEGST